MSAPQIGVPVWRCGDCGAICDVYNPSLPHGQHVDRRINDGTPHSSTNWTLGVWFSRDPAALASVRDVTERAINDASEQGLGIASQARYVMEALGLIPDDGGDDRG